MQLSLLHSKGYGDPETPTDSPVAVEDASLALLDEAEKRHAQVLASRRRDHLSIVGSLQSEYITALHTIKATGAARDALPIGDASLAPTAAAAADGASSIHEAPTGASCWGSSVGCSVSPSASEHADGAMLVASAGALSAAAAGGYATWAWASQAHAPLLASADGGGSAAEAYHPYTDSSVSAVVKREQQLQRELFALEERIQQLKDRLLAKDRGLAAAERTLLELRGAVAAAEDARDESDARADEAEQRARAINDALQKALAELDVRRREVDDAGGAGRAWDKERAELRAALARSEEQRLADAGHIHDEHEKAMRALEERLSFETASREYDRKEAQQLSAALKSMRSQRGGEGGLETPPGGRPSAGGKKRAKPPRARGTPDGEGVSFEAGASVTPKGGKGRRPSMPPALAPSAGEERPADKGRSRPARESDEPVAESNLTTPNSGFGARAVQRAGAHAAADDSAAAPSASKPKAKAAPARRTKPSAASTPLGQ